MKYLIALFTIIVLANSVPAQTLYPTYPGTSIRDYSRPGYKIEGNRISPTLPGSNIKDYSRPGYRIEKGYGNTRIVPTIPGTSIRDYSRPGYILR